ncbi:MAG: hypothetical protein JSV33_09305 [bacterium]|nr:MAG: hypothetical protein JSV33_09305 [bacterium]
MRIPARTPSINGMSILLLTFLMIQLTSCEETIQPTDQSGENVNPNKPNANNLIVQETVLGDADKYSTIYEIIDAGDDNFLFRGYYHNRYAIGKLDRNGLLVWLFRSRYTIRDFVRIPDLGGVLDNATVVVGSYDSDYDGDNDIGYITLINRNGTLIDELVYSVDTVDVWLNSLDIITSSDTMYTFLAAGGAEVSNKEYPYVARFTISDDSIMTKKEQKVFFDIPDIVFTNIKAEPEQDPASCFVTGYQFNENEDIGEQKIIKLTNSLTAPWQQDIIPQDGYDSYSLMGRSLLCSNDRLFIVGYTDVNKADNPPEGYWDAGFVASLSFSGNMNWIKTVILSQYTECFRSCFLDNGILYITGNYSNFVILESSEVFGYGLLSTVNPLTGDLISHMSFGDEGYSSAFNTLFVDGTTVFAAGYTNYANEGGTYQAWFVVIDISGSSSITLKEQPVNIPVNGIPEPQQRLRYE